MAGQGRKPKTEAIRRNHAITIADHAPLAIPSEVASNELMLECWDWTTAGTSHFTEADVPMLTLLAQWWAVARQCSANLASESGGVITQVQTPMGARQDPDIRTLQLATNQIRQLSSELGVGPLARTRMGLMKVATASMAADLPAKIFKALDEHGW
jgi:hypothetical protein